jgi:hypothetical protein
METIRIQVPSELARRLRRHYDELPQILEWGLRHVEEGETEIGPLSPTTEQADTPRREEVLATLRSAGVLVSLDPAIAAQYQADADQRRHTPVHVEGKPLSEMIIEKRREHIDRSSASRQSF